MSMVPIAFRFVPEMVTILNDLCRSKPHIVARLKDTAVEVFSRESTKRQIEEVLPQYASHITEIEIAEKFHDETPDGVMHMTANLYVEHSILGVKAPVGAVHIYDDAHLSIDVYRNHTNGADRRFLKKWGIPIRDFNGARTGRMPDPSKRSRKTSQTRDRTHGKRTAKADVETGTGRSSNAHDSRNAGGRSFSTYAPGAHYGGIPSGFTGSGQMYPVGSFQHHGPVFAGHQPQPGNPMTPGFASYGNAPGTMPSQLQAAGGSMAHGQHANAALGTSQYMGHVAPGTVLPSGTSYGQPNQGNSMSMSYAQPGMAFSMPVYSFQQPPQVYGRAITQEQWDAMRQAGWNANTASGGASSSDIRGHGR